MLYSATLLYSLLTYTLLKAENLGKPTIQKIISHVFCIELLYTAKLLSRKTFMVGTVHGKTFVVVAS